MKRLLLLILLVGCGSSNNNRATWHATSIDQFMTECTAKAPAAYCTCVLDKMMEAYTEDQVVALWNQGKLPPEAIQWAKECGG